MSVIIRLGPSIGYGVLNHHDVDNSGGLDIGHLVELNMDARHAGRRGQLHNLPKYLKAQIIFRST